jgi:hypothetical protein
LLAAQLAPWVGVPMTPQAGKELCAVWGTMPLSNSRVDRRPTERSAQREPQRPPGAPLRQQPVSWSSPNGHAVTPPALLPQRHLDLYSPDMNATVYCCKTSRCPRPRQPGPPAASHTGHAPTALLFHSHSSARRRPCRGLRPARSSSSASQALPGAVGRHDRQIGCLDPGEAGAPLQGAGVPRPSARPLAPKPPPRRGSWPSRRLYEPTGPPGPLPTPPSAVHTEGRSPAQTWCGGATAPARASMGGAMPWQCRLSVVTGGRGFRRWTTTAAWRIRRRA